MHIHSPVWRLNDNWDQNVYNSAKCKIYIRVTARRDMARHDTAAFCFIRKVILCANSSVVLHLLLGLLVSHAFMWAIHPLAAGGGANRLDFCSCTIYKCYGDQLLRLIQREKKKYWNLRCILLTVWWIRIYSAMKLNALQNFNIKLLSI